MERHLLREAPFRSLPINNGDLFDLTAEFLRAKLIAALDCYQQIVGFALAMTSDTLKFAEDDQLFNAMDNFISNYAQINKCVKFSLGFPIPPMNSPQQVFNDHGYLTGQPLHESIAGIRNTGAHFEERLQEFGQRTDPFLQISYNGLNYTWQSRFGVGGYQKSASGRMEKESFDEKKLVFHSYKLTGTKGNKTVVDVNINLHEIVQDIEKIAQLLKDNINEVTARKSPWCPPIRDLTVIMRPDDDE